MESAKENKASSSALPNEEHGSLLKLQRDILETVALSNSHIDTLNKLCLLVEAMLPHAAASIMIYDENREHLVVRTAPNLSEEAIHQLNGLIPGPDAGSCGTAVFSDKPVFVENTATDPRWQAFSQFAHDFHVEACWSYPIHLPGDIVIGSFALSSFEKRAPTEFHQHLLHIAASLAGIILQREKMESALWDMAHYDRLTQLPNRTLFKQQLKRAIDNASHHKVKMALLLVDIDNFKHINDSYGHNAGDELLINVSNTIRLCVGSEVIIARAGPDEFIVLLENLTALIDVSITAQNILDAFNQPHLINNTQIALTVSIGISVYPDDTTDVNDLLRNADTAMHKAKADGRNSYNYYEPALTYEIQQQLKIESELRHAIANDEFELYYQPEYSTQNNQIVSAEALIRWNHPERGFISPGFFIPVAEKSDLILTIGSWALTTACRQGHKWLEAGINLDKISVNFSVRQLKLGCHKIINNILAETNYPAKKLELEITESLLMERGEEAIAELEVLQDLGISIALDDFGTGYSSLHQLGKLPIDKLKIDRSFISDLPGNENDLILTKLIISMGKSLNLEVIAEGVETESQMQLLIKEGCDILQGFYLSRPIPATELEKLLLTQQNS